MAQANATRPLPVRSVQRTLPLASTASTDVFPLAAGAGHAGTEAAPSVKDASLQRWHPRSPPVELDIPSPTGALAARSARPYACIRMPTFGVQPIIKIGLLKQMNDPHFHRSLKL